MNSSAGGSKNACRFRSTARTQNPSALSRLTRWPPIKPPAPFTSTLFMSTSSYDSINLGQCGTRMGLEAALGVGVGGVTLNGKDANDVCAIADGHEHQRGGAARRVAKGQAAGLGQLRWVAQNQLASFLDGPPRRVRGRDAVIHRRAVGALALADMHVA